MRKIMALCAALTSGCTHYGKDGTDVALKWYHGPVVVEVSEGYSFHGNDGSQAPREWFEAKLGYEWRLK